MQVDEGFAFKSWIAHLDICGRKLSSLAKGLVRTDAEDPFIRKQHFEKADIILSELGLSSLAPPPTARTELENECIQQSVEFWKHFSAEASQQGWEIYGTTDRRLLNRGIFLELKGDKVIVEGLGTRLSPYIPSVIEKLKPEIDALLPKDGNLSDFTALVASAYEQVPGHEERSLEAVYRQSVLVYQAPGFWKNISQQKFQLLTRPMFRARLAEVLRLGLKSQDGRSIRFGTTMERGEAWEIFSPGEERVVQVGRISLI